MSKMLSVYLSLVFLCFACSLELPIVTNKTLRECVQANSVSISLPDPTNNSRIKLAIDGSIVDVSKIEWKILLNNSEIFSSTDITPIINLTQEGVFTVVCKITSNCNTSYNLSNSYNYIKKRCTKATSININTTPSTPLDLGLSLNGNISDISSVIWFVLKNGASVYESTSQSNSPFSFNTPTLNTDGDLSIIAKIVDKCGETYQLASNYSYNVPSIYNFSMITVEGGTFQMGSNDGDADEQPVHSVTLSNFKISKYEITQNQWNVVMGENPSYFKGCDNCPVETVSWEDAIIFLNKLNKLTGKSYRLPTEAEWEFAARGGLKSKGYKYSGSNTVDAVGWYEGNSNGKTHEVGQKQANELGIFDMTGNVREWCNDRYQQYSSESQVNPTFPINLTLPKTGNDWLALRGATWFFSSNACRTADRDTFTPDFRDFSIGFRIVSP